MEQILGWARLWFAAKREDEGETSLRNGAWYPVLSSGVNRAVLEVSGQRVTVPQDLVEVREKRPDRFTVVYRTYDDPNPAPRRDHSLARHLSQVQARRDRGVVGDGVKAKGMTRLGIEPRTYGLKVRCSTN